MKYTPTQFATAEDKEKFVAWFIKFVEEGFPQGMFNKKFYQRLSNTFGHIVHYDQSGFWATFFTTTQGKVDFLEMTMSYPCYGDPNYTFSDAEKEIQRQLKEKNLLNTWQETRAKEKDNQEYSEYLRLKRRFEIPA